MLGLSRPLQKDWCRLNGLTDKVTLASLLHQQFIPCLLCGVGVFGFRGLPWSTTVRREEAIGRCRATILTNLGIVPSIRTLFHQTNGK